MKLLWKLLDIHFVKTLDKVQEFSETAFKALEFELDLLVVAL